MKLCWNYEQFSWLRNTRIFTKFSQECDRFESYCVENENSNFSRFWTVGKFPLTTQNWFPRFVLMNWLRSEIPSHTPDPDVRTNSIPPMMTIMPAHKLLQLQFEATIFHLEDKTTVEYEVRKAIQWRVKIGKSEAISMSFSLIRQEFKETMVRRASEYVENFQTPYVTIESFPYWHSQSISSTQKTTKNCLYQV